MTTRINTLSVDDYIMWKHIDCDTLQIEGDGFMLLINCDADLLNVLHGLHGALISAFAAENKTLQQDFDLNAEIEKLRE